ncbi:hypothetical protein MA13_contig00001-0178 [Edwardsiella piscicida]|nr:hypothetical protein MA13_contig00001-0178 [Edwardsiella piscicida]
MLGIGPGTSRTVKAVWLIHVKQRNRLPAQIHLATQRIRYGLHRAPPTGGGAVRFYFGFHDSLDFTQRGYKYSQVGLSGSAPGYHGTKSHTGRKGPV